jgi:tRNA nucleotidyltransferase (CCA-adding enzyme)
MEVILTHDNTDLDAIASMLAAKKLYPRAYAVVPRRPNRNVRDFLAFYWDELPFTRQEDLPRRRIERIVLVDTQSSAQLRGIRPDAELLIIDHHPLDRPLDQGALYRGGDTGATTTLLVEELHEQQFHPTPVEATLLLAGIYEDTGSLSYSTTTPRDVRCAAWLLEHGANLEVVNDFLHHPLTDLQLKLYDDLVEAAESIDVAGHTVIISTARCDRYVEEISTLAHKLRDLLDPDALFLLVAFDSRIQVVARSSVDAIDVGEIARELGGGGHAKAAAALISSGDLAEARRRLIELLDQHVRPLVTVRDIMSLGAVRTLSPDTTVAEAAEMMQRFGHEGFPVVDHGQLVGVLRRREIDRGMIHGLGNTPIALYMHKGAIHVSPDDSVQRLQQLMTEYELGQVPVLEDGEIVGIVTRTDLLKLWSEPSQPVRAHQLATKLEQALPAELLKLNRQAAEVAHDMGFAIYLVGGFVRDLLLGVPSHADIDLVVEGDAMELAWRLTARYGGRAHTHARFGTAKWIVRPDLALDFVTARTEFYEQPSVLPTVERGSLKSDLHRRDFTINTMAIALAPDRYGQLIDFYGGEADLERKLIRVLHSLSFIEDPTRILRAVRLEQRLGFRIESRTEELIDDALPLLDRVSSERIRKELYLIFNEPEPARALRRLAQLGVLHQVDCSLTWDNWLEDKFAAVDVRVAEWAVLVGKPVEVQMRPRFGVRSKRPSSIPWPLTPTHYLALLVYRLAEPAIGVVSRRLRIPKEQAELLQAIPGLRQAADSLASPDLPPRMIYRLLSPFTDDALALLWIAADGETVRHHLRLYQAGLRQIEPELTGHDLRAMGLKPGPIYRQILSALRDARLDGKIQTRQEEEALAREIAESALAVS